MCGHACQPAGTKRLLLAVPDSSVWVSQLGTKDKMIDRLVEKEKPPGGCAPHSSKPRANLAVVHEPQLLLAPPGAAAC